MTANTRRGAPETLEEARAADREHARMRELEALALEAIGVHDRIRAKVKQLRKAGVSWARIGGVLGVSKQAAQQRFDKKR